MMAGKSIQWTLVSPACDAHPIVTARQHDSPDTAIISVPPLRTVPRLQVTDCGFFGMQIAKDSLKSTRYHE